MLLSFVAEGIAPDAGVQGFRDTLFFSNLLHLSLIHADIESVYELSVQQCFPLVVDPHQDPACDVDDGRASGRVDEGRIDHPVDDVGNRPGTVRCEERVDTDDLRQLPAHLGIRVIYAGGHLVIEREDQVERVFLVLLRQESGHDAPGV